MPSTTTSRAFNVGIARPTSNPPSEPRIIYFRAAGWTETAWHLYQWGDTVEVIAPEELKLMVEGYRREDFYPVLP